MKIFLIALGTVFLFAKGQNHNRFSPAELTKIYGEKVSRHLNQIVKSANKRNHKILSIEKKGQTFYVKTAISKKFCEQRAYQYHSKKDQLNDLEIVSYCH